MPTSIHQEVTLKASPKRIYDALMDSKQHAEFTANGDCSISREEGGLFSCHGGQISGRNIELQPEKRIVQAWRFKGWEPGVYSVVKFELQLKGADTVIVLDHTGIPEGESGHIEEGWPKMYWNKLRDYLK